MLEIAGRSRVGSDPLRARTIARRSASRPAPVSADTATTGATSSTAPQRSGPSALFLTITRGRVRVSSSTRRSSADSDFALIEHDEHEFRRRARLNAARHALAFDPIARVARARRVHERQRQALDVDALGHQVASRSWHIGDDGPVGADERVEEAGLPDVRPTGDHDRRAVAQQTAARWRRPAGHRSTATMPASSAATIDGSTK